MPTLAKGSLSALRYVGESMDRLMVEESATHIADIFGYPASTITRRNEKDSKLDAYPLGDGLTIVREYRREFPQLKQAVLEYLEPERSTTSMLSVEDRIAQTLQACTATIAELLPLVRHMPATDRGCTHVSRVLSELNRTAIKCRMALETQKGAT